MNLPETRYSLVLRLKRSDDERAWREFLELYEPLILQLVRRRGLQDADAREVTQEVLLAVSRAVERWDPSPERGSFRGWLATITRNLLVNYLERQKRQPRGSGDSQFQAWLELQPAADSAASQWFDREQQLQRFRWAAQRIRHDFHETTWRAFWRTSVDGLSAEAAARELGVTVGVVYMARSRVMKRLRAAVEQVQSEEGA